MIKTVFEQTSLNNELKILFKSFKYLHQLLFI